jgi:hypothetical protein
MKKETAVEWLVNELNQKIDFIPMDKWDMIRDIVQQSKAMEKEQILEAYNNGEDRSAELYYNETFKSE